MKTHNLVRMIEEAKRQLKSEDYSNSVNSAVNELLKYMNMLIEDGLITQQEAQTLTAILEKIYR